MKKMIIIGIIAVVHLGLVFALAAATFDLSGIFFGVYPPPAEGFLHDFMSTLHNILIFPFGKMAYAAAGGLGFLAWPLMILNSLVWGGLIYTIAAKLAGIRKRSGRAAVH